MLGKTVPANKRAGVKSVLGAMKNLLETDEGNFLSDIFQSFYSNLIIQY